LEQSLALRQEMSDWAAVAHLRVRLATLVRDQGDYASARALFAESLTYWRERGDKSAIGETLNGMGDAAREQGEAQEATKLYEEALALAHDMGDLHQINLVKSNLGRALHDRGDRVQGIALLQKSVAWFREVGHGWGLMWALHHLSAAVYAQGDIEQAAPLLQEALELEHRMGQKRQIAGSLQRIAGLATLRRQTVSGARIFAAASTLRSLIGAPLPPAERILYERDMAAIRAQLDEATLATAWKAGQALTLEEAVAEALALNSETGAEGDSYAAKP
jgi:tetratricopeptide (TPR) repeat protein